MDEDAIDRRSNGEHSPDAIGHNWVLPIGRGTELLSTAPRHKTPLSSV
jgi:hypothetical protein